MNIGRRKHPDPESAYMVEGEITLLVDGAPPRVVKVGERYQIGPGVAHDAKGGLAGAKVIATYVVEKGKPLASPAQ